MKKICILLVLGLLFSLTACAGAPEGPGTAGTDGSSVEGGSTSSSVGDSFCAPPIGTPIKTSADPFFSYSFGNPLPDADALPEIPPAEVFRKVFSHTSSEGWNEAKEKALLEDYFASHGIPSDPYPDAWVDWICSFEDTVVCYLRDAGPTTDGVITETVAGWTFQGPPVVYRQGTFYSLKDAYADGILTEDQVSKVWLSLEDVVRYLSERTDYSVSRMGLFSTLSNRFGAPAEVYGDAYIRIYGKWNGSLVLYLIREEGQTSLTVNGATFTAEEPFEIYVYGSGGFRTLEEAFRQGMLRDWDLKNLALYHERRKQADLLRIGDLAPLPENRMDAMEVALSTKLSLTAKLQYEDYYGTFGGRPVVLQVSDPTFWEDLKSGITVLRAVNDFWIFDGNTPVPLKEGWEKGWFTEEDLKAIATLHEARFPTLYVDLLGPADGDPVVNGRVQAGWYRFYHTRLLLSEARLYGQVKDYLVFTAFQVSPGGVSKDIYAYKDEVYFRLSALRSAGILTEAEYQAIRSWAE